MVREGEPYAALIATKRKSRWGLPKGTVDEGEQPEQTAVREVLEETGLRAEVLIPLRSIEYYFRAGAGLVHKNVDFFLMRYVGGQLRPQLSEVDDVQWFALEEAISRSSFQSERKVLEQARQIWQNLADPERMRFHPAE